MGICIEKAEHIFLDSLEVIIYLNQEITEELGEEIKELIYCWYKLGTYNAFDGSIHNISEVWFAEQELGFNVDLGSTSQRALDILLDSIEGFAELNGIDVKKVFLGNVLS